MFGYSCPSCSQRLLASVERVGQRTICPKCVKPIVIPSPTANVPEPPPIVLTPLPVMDQGTDEVPIELMPALDDEPQSEVPMSLADDLPVGPEHSNGYFPESIRPNSGSPNGYPTRPDASGLPPASATIQPMPTPPPMPSPISYEPSATIGANMPTPVPNIPLPTPYHGKASLPPPPLPPRTTNAYGSIGTQAPFFGPPIGFPRSPATTPPPVGNSQDSGRHAGEPGMIVFNPTEFESADIAAELTAALTMRMKPPPEPPSDLRLSTGLWIFLTAVALGIWAYSMVANLDPLKYVAYIAIAELVIGYLWVGYFAGRRSIVKGLIALLPPIWFRKLITPPSTQGYRPLRFIITGLLLLALYFVSPAVQPVIYNVAGLADDSPKRVIDIPESATTTLVIAEQDDNTRAILMQLRKLSAPESLLDRTIQDDLPKLLPKLLELRSSKSIEVRTEALSAYITWTYDREPAAAKAELLKAIRAESESERTRALELAARWKDVEIASGVAQNLSSSDYGPTAYATLETIGGATTEAAVLPLLKSEDVLAYTRALELLERFGGAKALAVLEKMEADAKTNSQKSEYRQSIKKIKARLTAS